jgi:ABC-type branched-subunit amino acid transport system substrate-binding protein
MVSSAEAAVATNLPLITVGLLAPTRAEEYANLSQGALLAVETANSETGTKARLVVREMPGQWGTEGNQAAALALDDEVDGLITPFSGSAAHQMLQVAGRTRVPVVSLCADSSVTSAGIPWVVRVVPRTADEARVIFLGLTNVASTSHRSATLEREQRGSVAQDGPARWADRRPFRNELRWAALVPTDRSGREAAHDLLEAASSAACDLSEPIRIPENQGDWNSVLGRLLGGQPEAVLLWTDALTAAKLARALRQRGFHGLLAGPSWLGTMSFLKQTGAAAEGFIVAAIDSEISNAAASNSFDRTYEARFGRKPDLSARMAYDAALLLIRVAQTTTGEPLCRVFPLSGEFKGVTGPLRFDERGNRLVTLRLLQCRHGKFTKLPGDSTSLAGGDTTQERSYER